MAATLSPTPPLRPEALLHVNQAQHNWQAYQHLLQTSNFPDWALTSLFYTALHLVQAYAVQTAPDPSLAPANHTQRNQFVRDRLRPINPHYRTLYDRSREVRYEPGRPRPTPEQLRQFEQQEFAAIAAHLRPFGISLAP